MDTSDCFEWGVSNDPLDPDALLFTGQWGRPVRHSNFYKRTFRPALIGNEKQGVPPALPSALHGLRCMTSATPRRRSRWRSRRTST